MQVTFVYLRLPSGKDHVHPVSSGKESSLWGPLSSRNLGSALKGGFFQSVGKKMETSSYVLIMGCENVKAGR